MIAFRPPVSGAAIAATVSLAFSPAFAQSEHHCFDGTDWGTCAGVRYSHDLDAAAVSLKPVARDFTGDHRVDILMCLGNQPFISVGAGAMNYETDLALPGGAFAVAALGSVQFPSRTVPSMLGSLDNGLAVWEVDPGTGQLSTQVPVGALDWAGAHTICSVDLDGDQLDELVGYFEVGSNSMLRVGSWTGDPAVPGTLTISTTATLAMGGHLTSVEGQTGAPGRIVLTGGNRVAFFGDLLQFHSIHFLPGPIVASCPITDAMGQAVAALTRDAQGVESLTVIRGGVAEASVEIGDLGTRAMVSADFLAGAKGDLALLGDEVMLLENRSALGGATFVDDLGFEFRGLGTSDLNSQSDWIVASDLDNDGDSDVALHWETGNLLVPHRLLVAFNTHELEGYETARFPVLELVETGPPLSFNRTVTGTISNVAAMASLGATHVEVLLMISDGDVIMDRCPLSHAVAGELDVSVSYSSLGVPPDTLAEIFFRPVTVDSTSGQSTAAGPDFRMTILTAVADFTGVSVVSVHDGSASSGGLPGPTDPNNGNGPPPPAGGPTTGG